MLPNPLSTGTDLALAPQKRSVADMQRRLGVPHTPTAENMRHQAAIRKHVSGQPTAVAMDPATSAAAGNVRSTKGDLDTSCGASAASLSRLLQQVSHVASRSCARSRSADAPAPLHHVLPGVLPFPAPGWHMTLTPLVRMSLRPQRQPIGRDCSGPAHFLVFVRTSAQAGP